jgi:hypothetical protein
MLFNNKKKEGAIDTHNNLDGLKDILSSEKEPVSKGNVLWIYS